MQILGSGDVQINDDGSRNDNNGGIEQQRRRYDLAIAKQAYQGNVTLPDSGGITQNFGSPG